jgi:hypothetical protein
MIRAVLFSALGFFLLSCGGAKTADRATEIVGPVDALALSCEVSFTEPENSEAQVPVQSHLKQSASLMDGAATVRTPDFNAGGGRFRYEAVRTVDGIIALMVICGNSGDSHSFGSKSDQLMASVQCSKIPMAEWVYFSSSQERKDNPDMDWDSARKVETILVDCKVK